MKRILSISALLAAVLLLASCKKEPPVIHVTAISLNQTSVTLTEGESISISATVFPADANDKSFSWSSSNESVATVSGGTVTAVAPGSATITARTSDGGKTATCSITVKAKVYNVESVSLDKTELDLVEGDAATLTATVKPDNATDKSVVWSSSDEKVATVKDGKVSAVTPGTATITVKTTDGGKTAECKVTVSERIYNVESVSLDRTELDLIEGDSATLTATVEPEYATDCSVTWSTSDKTVATVKNGKVTAVAPGTATVTVKTNDGGLTATCKVIVRKRIYPVESVSLSKTALELTEGDTASLTATVKPDNATDKTVTWSTSDKTVATVKDGKVTAVAPGTATVTVKTNDGGLTATCKVTVKAKVYPVESVSLDKTSLELMEGDSATLKATVKPDNATDKTVTWSTSDKTVATVKDGKVTAVKKGTATITVKTADGGKTATCKVTVSTTGGSFEDYDFEHVDLTK